MDISSVFLPKVIFLKKDLKYNYKKKKKEIYLP